MNEMDVYCLQSPEDVGDVMAAKLRQLRLSRGWKQTTLAERSGVSVASLRRFERTGLVSLQNFLRLVFALGRLADFDAVLDLPKAGSIRELEALESFSKPKRGRE